MTTTPVEAAAVYITCVKEEGAACFVPDTVPTSGRRRRLSKTFIDIVVLHTENLGPSFNVMDGSTGFLATLQRELAARKVDTAVELEGAVAIVTTIQFRPEDMTAPLPAASALGPTVSDVETIPAPLSGTTASTPIPKAEGPPARQRALPVFVGLLILAVTCCIVGVIAAVPLVRGKLNQSGSRSSSSNVEKEEDKPARDVDNVTMDRAEFDDMDSDDEMGAFDNPLRNGGPAVQAPGEDEGTFEQESDRAFVEYSSVTDRVHSLEEMGDDT